MTKRINVILPEDTVRTIDCAVQHSFTTDSPRALRERLKQAAIRDRDFDLGITRDWFAVDQEGLTRIHVYRR